MEIISVKPKGIYVNIEFTVEELEMVRDGIGLAEIKFDGTKMAEYKAKESVEKFHKLIDGLLEDLRHGS